MLDRPHKPTLRFDAAQRGDGLELLQSLPDCSAAAVIFDRNTGACSTISDTATKVLAKSSVAVYRK